MYSSNHTHITGDFAEHLMMYWLSKNGYECVHVRHIGVDIIAKGKRLGISVKSRSRKQGVSEYGFTMGKPSEHIDKIRKTCSDFGCDGYFAFVLDQMGKIMVYMMPIETIERYYTISTKSSQDWNMLKLENDKDIIKFELKWDNLSFDFG